MFAGCSSCDPEIFDPVARNEIVQYQPSSDEWNLIGNLQVPRGSPLVVQVPPSFCDKIQ